MVTQLALAESEQRSRESLSWYQYEENGELKSALHSSKSDPKL